MYVCIYVCMYACMYICVYVYESIKEFKYYNSLLSIFDWDTDFIKNH